MKIAILGAGALAIALAKLIEDDGHEVFMWTKFEEEKATLIKHRENIKLFPGVKLNENVKVTCDIGEAISNACVIINVLPFIAIKDTIDIMKDFYNKSQVIISTTKGIDENEFITTTDLFEEYLKATKIAALSGPSFAIEIANKENISFMLGTKDKEVIEISKKILSKPSIKIEVTDDIKGIQLAGGIKNAIAVGSGMLYGMEAADSTKAAYLATGMADMSHLLVALGGKKETAYSYAGIGDLILTCTSHTSRNFSFGYYLGEGYTVDEAFEKMNNKTVEGYKVIRALHKYVKEKNIKTYMIDTLYKIIFENGNVEDIKKV